MTSSGSKPVKPVSRVSNSQENSRFSPSASHGSAHQQPNSRAGIRGKEGADRNLEVDENSQSTRDKIVNIILHEGEMTAAELAERLDLTAAAIRRHLNSLIAQRTIDVQEQKTRGSRGRGRPASVYVLTEEGRSRFYQAYDEIAIEALSALAEALGGEAVEAIAEKRLANIEQIYLKKRAQNPTEDPVNALADALMAAGITTTIQPAVRGDQLCQHHCPVALVAEKFPQICEVENRMFSKLLGLHVQRLATIAHGDGVCTLHIPDVPARGPVKVDPPRLRSSEGK